jgi:hypothetical protein
MVSMATTIAGFRINRVVAGFNWNCRKRRKLIESSGGVIETENSRTDFLFDMKSTSLDGQNWTTVARHEDRVPMGAPFDAVQALVRSQPADAPANLSELVSELENLRVRKEGSGKSRHGFWRHVSRARYDVCSSAR